MGRHKKDCGIKFPCPTGAHDNKSDSTPRPSSVPATSPINSKPDSKVSAKSSVAPNPAQSDKESNIAKIKEIEEQIKKLEQQIETEDELDDTEEIVDGNESESQQPIQIVVSQSKTDVLWNNLRVLSQTFEDVQKLRIQMNNRRSAVQRGGAVEPQALITSIESLEQTEKILSKDMRNLVKQVTPEIWQWVQDTPGIGEHLIARLLGTIGDPIVARPYHWEGDGENRKLIADAPFQRNIGKLWAYCGYGNPEFKRKKGMTKEEAFKLGNPQAKKIVYLLAVSCIKVTGKGIKSDKVTESGNSSKRSPYRDIYDSAKTKYTQTRPEWTDGHRHNAALRIVGKEILRDMWIVHSKRNG